MDRLEEEKADVTLVTQYTGQVGGCLTVLFSLRCGMMRQAGCVSAHHDQH